MPSIGEFHNVNLSLSASDMVLLNQKAFFVDAHLL
jgi:hypothetical protein